MFLYFPCARSDSWCRGVFPRSERYSDPSMTLPSVSSFFSLLATSL